MRRGEGREGRRKGIVGVWGRREEGRREKGRKGEDMIREGWKGEE